MSPLYAFDERLVLRTPRYPLTVLNNGMDVQKLLHDNAFLEAIYLASPVLYEACIKWRDGHITGKKEIEKLSRSLFKYYIRMSSRCTPFGLFSGCSVVSWNPEATAVTVQGMQRHTRLDMHYLCALAAQLAMLPGIHQKLLYYPNSSVYTIGDELRYVEYLYTNGRRIHQISAVQASEYLQRVVSAAGNGATIQQLGSLLVSASITAAEAQAFIEELIQAQVLVSEMEPAITGPEFIHQLIHILERIAEEGDTLVLHALHTLRRVDECLRTLDAGAGNEVAQYGHIMQLLDELGVTYDQSKLFQADMVQQAAGPGIHTTLQQQLQEALEVMNKLAARKRHPDLQAFKQRFRQRYDEKEMPLLEVLDTETGIGYINGSSNNNITPLVDDVAVGHHEREHHYTWGQLETLRHKWLLEAYTGGRYNIDINETDLEGLTADWNDLPPSFFLMFRILEDAPCTLYIESAGGSSAAGLLGRFAHADAAIHTLVSEVTRQEQERDPGIVYAEVIHLPESRTGNVLLHPAFREYEIPYLARSSRNKEQQIDVQDLYVSVKNDRVVLHSRRLGKEIIPRLSTAHNYTSNALPVYRFLCDLQSQDKRAALGFDWGPLEEQYYFLPRITYKHTILQLATWCFRQQHIQHLLSLEGTALQEALGRFREQWRLPQYLVLADGDNELLVDLNNNLMVSAWLETVKQRRRFTMREFIHRQQQVTDQQGNGYVNQLVAVLNRQAPAYAGAGIVKPADVHQQPLQRQFVPGSEWLYYKLYCGVRSADKILLQAVKPLAALLEQAGRIDKWFFIRYNDPEFHLRLRFHVTAVSQVGGIMNKVHEYLQPFIAAGYIHKLQLDTYNREAERYGSNSMELAETFFHLDSVACTAMLENTGGDEREHIRWLWGLRAVDELLTCFRLTAAEKRDLVLPLKTAFAAEFNMDKTLKRQLDEKYRRYRADIERILDPAQDQQHELHTLINILRERSAAMMQLAAEILYLQETGRLQVPLANLLASYLHMMINRIALADARKQEMVMYDFLARHYQSLVARAGLVPTISGFM